MFLIPFHWDRKGRCCRISADQCIPDRKRAEAGSGGGRFCIGFYDNGKVYCSGLNFAYNPHRMILNKVTDCYLTRADGERIEIQDDKLYHVVTDLYTGQMLGSVMKMSYGLLSLEPKDRDGNPIENLKIRRSWKVTGS